MNVMFLDNRLDMKIGGRPEKSTFIIVVAKVCPVIMYTALFNIVDFQIFMRRFMDFKFNTPGWKKIIELVVCRLWNIL